MNPPGKSSKTGLRLVVCILLLAWIFHVIFLNEAKASHGSAAQPWDSLARVEQWKRAWSTGPAELWATLSASKPTGLLISFGCVGVVIALGIARWRLTLLVQGIHLPWSRCAEISMVAHFFNSFLLGSTGGDLIKAYYAARESQHLRTQAVVTVAVDRIMGLFAMLLFAVAMMPPNLQIILSDKQFAAVCLTILAMLVALGLFASAALWSGLSRSFPSARTWLRKIPKGNLIEDSIESCRPFGGNPHFLIKAMTLSILLNVACVLQVAAIASSLNSSIPITALFLVVPCIICISALPITPSGLGIRENLYVIMLAAPTIGLPDKTALSISILAFAGNLAWSLIGGLVYLFFKEQHHLTEITKPSGG